MTPPSEFAAKWKGSTRTERAASQEHFIDLCRMLGVPTPNDADPTGEWYAFEKGAAKSAGGDGFADVWKRGHFAWEYKGKRKDLGAAYQQLLQYREALENPPCLVVCDLHRFEVHTNFTGTKPAIHSFTLDTLRTAPAEPLRILRAVLQNPEALRPSVTREQVTEEAAARFAELADKLQKRGQPPQAVAHFLNRLLFCFFAEDIGVLPSGLVTRLMEVTKKTPEKFTAQLRQLFVLMSKGKGYFGTEEIEWFNGGLFDTAEVLPLTSEDVETLLVAARLDWSSIEPAILGTLFERGLDPDKRGQLGAHYTDKASILRVVEPVVLAPLRREFADMKVKVEKLLAAGKKPTAAAKGKDNPNAVFRAFLDRLRGVRVLDPACGSGNFLYVTLQLLKDLEKEVILWGAETMKTTQEFPGVGPEVVRGIELNAYASELARVTIWIGEIQWMVSNGFNFRTDPILRPLDSVECHDAVLDLTEPDHPRRVRWPDAEFICGNPPFIGGKQMRESLGDEYVNALFAAWKGQVPREADFVCYWHEQAREMIEKKRCQRAGLLSTQGIRTGANLKVLKRIKESGDLFLAWSDQPWVVDGADVRISIVGQDDGSEIHRELDGSRVDVIHADLTGGATDTVDLTSARPLLENSGIGFMGDTKGGAFDINRDVAVMLLRAGPNPNGKPNSDVVVPWMNSMDLTRRPRGVFVIDFGVGTAEEVAARYEAPFEYARKTIMPARAKSRSTTKSWWQHERPRPEMRAALAPLARFLVTPTTAKFRTFAWLRPPTLPDHQLIVFAREDDYFFGILHSRVHELWSLRKIGRKGVGNDPVYAPTFAFEPFPFPWPLNTPETKLSKEQAAHMAAVSTAARELDAERSRWLNPPELVMVEPGVTPGLPSRLVPKDAGAEVELKKRTLTNLYNARPGWLDFAHRKLDAAVVAAYGWSANISDAEILAKLLALNRARSADRP
jgi:type II restriction/modification system DNA methylase subunit YeeA